MSSLIIISIPSTKRHYIVDVDKDIAMIGDIEITGSVLSIANGYIEAAVIANNLEKSREEI